MGEAGPVRPMLWIPILLRSSSGAGIAANDGFPAGMGDNPESGDDESDGVGGPDREHIGKGNSADTCTSNSNRG